MLLNRKRVKSNVTTSADLNKSVEVETKAVDTKPKKVRKPKKDEV